MSNVQHEDKYLGSLNVSQKLQTKPFVVMCVLYYAWNICNCHPVIVNKFHVAHRGLQRGEFVVGEFGKCSRSCCQKSRFSYVWEAHQSDICQGFELEIDNLRLTFLAISLLLLHVWVQFVAFPGLSSFSEHYTLLVCTQIKNKLSALLFLIEFDFIDQSSSWDSQQSFASIFSVFALSA